MNHSNNLRNSKFNFVKKGLCLLAGPFLFAGAVFGDTKSDRTGSLEVFSSTQEVQWGEGSFYYPHTGYQVFDASGKAVKWVENGNGSIDSFPEKVELAPGKYTVWAQSDRGYVKVPVTIKAAQMAELHLETSAPKNNFLTRE